MIRKRKNSFDTLSSAGVVLALAGVAMLAGGCVVQERVAAPPRRVYAPPPPPQTYAESAVDVEVRANEAPPP
jgi:drug/metabolite transporter (DMT)-like permease